MDAQARRGGGPVAERPSALLKIHLLGRFEVVRERETVEELIKGERVPSFL